MVGPNQVPVACVEFAVALAPTGRAVAFLEGGYDLDALRESVAATLPSLLGERISASEAPTSGGPGGAVVEAAREVHQLD